MILSSHNKEEEEIINNLQNIIKNKKVNIFIAPRHPNRSIGILEILKKYNFKISLASKENIENTDIKIIDSLGNLEKYFNKSEIVILGGSFIDKGGHNPIEPATFGCALITGNSLYNWQNIYEEMEKEKACIIINDILNLKDTINELINNKILLEKFKKKALDFSNKKFFDNEALFSEIDQVLK